MNLRGVVGSLLGSHKKRKIPGEKKRAEMKMRYLLEIENVEKAIKFENTSVVAIRLFSLIKDFFYELLDLKKSETLEEIAEELKHKRIDRELKWEAEHFLENLSEEEYSGRKITKRKVEATLSEFKSIVQGL